MSKAHFDYPGGLPVPSSSQCHFHQQVDDEDVADEREEANNESTPARARSGSGGQHSAACSLSSASSIAAAGSSCATTTTSGRTSDGIIHGPPSDITTVSTRSLLTSAQTPPPAAAAVVEPSNALGGSVVNSKQHHHHHHQQQQQLRRSRLKVLESQLSTPQEHAVTSTTVATLAAMEDLGMPVPRTKTSTTSDGGIGEAGMTNLDVPPLPKRASRDIARITERMTQDKELVARMSMIVSEELSKGYNGSSSSWEGDSEYSDSLCSAAGVGWEEEDVSYYHHSDPNHLGQHNFVPPIAGGRPPLTHHHHQYPQQQQQELRPKPLHSGRHVRVVSDTSSYEVLATPSRQGSVGGKGGGGGGGLNSTGAGVRSISTLDSLDSFFDGRENPHTASGHHVHGHHLAEINTSSQTTPSVRRANRLAEQEAEEAFDRIFSEPFHKVFSPSPTSTSTTTAGVSGGSPFGKHGQQTFHNSSSTSATAGSLSRQLLSAHEQQQQHQLRFEEKNNNDLIIEGADGGEDASSVRTDSTPAPVALEQQQRPQSNRRPQVPPLHLAESEAGGTALVPSSPAGKKKAQSGVSSGLRAGAVSALLPLLLGPEISSKTKYALNATAKGVSATGKVVGSALQGLWSAVCSIIGIPETAPSSTAAVDSLAKRRRSLGKSQKEEKEKQLLDDGQEHHGQFHHDGETPGRRGHSSRSNTDSLSSRHEMYRLRRENRTGRRGDRNEGTLDHAPAVDDTNVDRRFYMAAAMLINASIMWGLANNIKPSRLMRPLVEKVQIMFFSLQYANF